jgi:hypothetical protein
MYILKHLNAVRILEALKLESNFEKFFEFLKF